MASYSTGRFRITGFAKVLQGQLLGSARGRAADNVHYDRYRYIRFATASNSHPVTVKLPSDCVAEMVTRRHPPPEIVLCIGKCVGSDSAGASHYNNCEVSQLVCELVLYGPGWV
jgi:hypothetical protein